jgi:type II secretory pathway pseudopilin PulG
MTKGLKTQSGFTLGELMVVIVIIEMLVTFTLPGFFKSRNKAREAEVKSNIHTIQIALERYAVDNCGVYPPFLCGGERDSNILWCISDNFDNNTHPNAVWPDLSYLGDSKNRGVTPYAVIRPSDGKGNYTGRFKNGYDMINADPLLFFGYLSQYPRNPFAAKDAGMWNSDTKGGIGRPGKYPFGGYHGDIMFDLGFGWGDAPQTDFVLNVSGIEVADEGITNAISDPDLDAPGNFYYHPLFADGIPVYFHTCQLIECISSPFNLKPDREVYPEDVLGFFLYGYGAPGTSDSLDEAGMDLFNRMPEGFTSGGTPQPPFPDYSALTNITVKHCVNASNQKRTQTTGYNSTEYDPYTGAYPDGINPADSAEIYPVSGPDGIPDWVIITVSAGSDNQPRTEYK